jgi:ankyrin repeat protein
LKQPHIDVDNNNAANNNNNIGVVCGTTSQDKRPLSAACRNGNIEITKLLLDSGANPTLSDSKGSTPLHEACSYGWISIAKLLLDFCSTKNNTLKNNANNNASNNNHNKINLLLKLSDNHGFTPLHFAVWGENYHCGASYDDDENDDENENGNTTTNNLSKRKEDMVKLLLDRGADIDSQDMDGETALHLALLDMSILKKEEGGNEESSYATSPLVELLLERGANKTICDENGNSFFHKYGKFFVCCSTVL